MITKRFKQTAKLEEVKTLETTIKDLTVVLAEIDLPEIINMPNYNQVLRVTDVNVVISRDYIGLRPRRILIDKETSQELDLNLFVPEWEITASNLSSHVDQNGDRILYEMEWFNHETEEVVTTETVIVQDENGDDIEDVRELPELEDEVYLLPTINYLMYFAHNMMLPDLIEKFSQQFVADNIGVWSSLTK